MDAEERELLARITDQIERCSDHQHRLAQRRAVLRESATMLRMGRSASTVLALIQEQVPDAVTTIGAADAPSPPVRKTRKPLRLVPACTVETDQPGGRHPEET